MVMKSLRKALSRPAERVEDVPSAAAPVTDEAGELRAELARIRETVDLIESDLLNVIRDVSSSAANVHHGVEKAAHALSAIRERSGELSHMASTAAGNARQLAAATEEMSQSAHEIGNQVREASHLTQVATEASHAASRSVDGLRASTAEIDAVVGLIAKIARQTNLLALNATIEAARAGEMGKGFAVVANEVKNLSLETQRATEEITRRITQLQSDSGASIAAIREIAGAVENIRPVFASVSAAVEQQVSAVADLSQAAAQSSNFIETVTHGARDIDAAAREAAETSSEADKAGKQAQVLAEKLRSRFVIFLRQSDMGDRRKHDRLPADLPVRIASRDGSEEGKTVDISEGGMLVRIPSTARYGVGATYDATIQAVGAVRARVVAISPLGLHMQFTAMDEAVTAALATRLAELRQVDAERVERAVAAAGRIAKALEEAVNAGKITIDALFDNDYVPVAGSNPVQFTTRYLTLLEGILPQIQEPLLSTDARMTFCAAMDRNAYLPVHNRIYSHPQKPDDPVWNAANCRNRRIFDDRAGLAAARNTRPHLVQSYARDMGNGVTVMMKEIDAPIRVFGKHWGGFRMAYKL